MPKLSLFFVRTSLIYFCIGITFGGLLLANKGLNFNPSLWNILPIHIETLFFGWFLQFIFGVAYWIFPRFEEGSFKKKLVWVVFSFLNLGLILLLSTMLFINENIKKLAHILILLAIVSFGIYIWTRVKQNLLVN